MTELQEKAQKVLDKAPEALKQVERSFIFEKSKRRDFPQFDIAEIEIGNLLGTGGFSAVKEVSNITLQDDDDDEKTSSTDDDDDEAFLVPDSTNTNTAATTTTTTTTTTIAASSGSSIHDKDHAEHYNVDTARIHMTKHCQRLGSARYAIKRLKPQLDEFQKARGALDLAMEIKYMSAFWHPNIVKMRGLSNTPEISFDTFIIMDRLYGTLDDKIDSWHHDLTMIQGCCGSILQKDNEATRDLLKDRLLVAYDLSAAFHYLHSYRLVYRDIKPENIGFDIRGDVKIFDFGLCKTLDPREKVHGNFYKLTAKTGSIPYMAPEVVMGKPYNQYADVFSFGILLWEILTLKWAFNGYSPQEYFIRVAKNNERLAVPRNAPPMIRTILPEAWDKDPKCRPSMKRMGALIRGELEDITADAAILNRTQHMMNQSARSQHLRRMLSASNSGKPNLSNSRSGRSRRGSFIGGEIFDNAI